MAIFISYVKLPEGRSAETLGNFSLFLLPMIVDAIMGGA